jgi:membrane protease YdiL (CAAX protease family)
LNDSLRAALTAKGIAYQTRIQGQDFQNGGGLGWVILLSIFIVGAGTALLLRRPGTKKFYQQETATPRAERRELAFAAAFAALVMIGLSLLLLVVEDAHASKAISGAEARRLISANQNTSFEVYQFNNGSKELGITQYPSRTHPSFITPADEGILALLAEHNISYETYVQGRDFGYRGPSRSFALSCSFILAAGAVILLWWALKREKTLRMVMAVFAALAMIAISALLFLFTQAHAAKTISGAEARRMISEPQGLTFEVFQVYDGSKDLWITQPGSRTYPTFKTPGDESTLALLAKNEIPYKTFMQGRDFGYSGPDRWLALTFIFVLTTGAALLLWWVLKQKKSLPIPAACSEL